MAEDSQGPLDRINYTGVADWVSTLSPTVIFNMRVSANRYIEAARTEIALDFDPATLGFPSSYAGQVPIKMFPRFNVTDYINLGRGGFNREPTNTYSFQPNMTLIRGNHTARFGADIRFTQYAQQFSGRAAGEFNFNRNLTRFNFNNDNANPNVPAGIGRSPTSRVIPSPRSSSVRRPNAFVENQLFPIYMWKYYAPWFQDDWKITPKLTLNFGARWDFNGPPKERYNRANFGFDASAVNPVSSRLPNGLQVRGGIGFVGEDGNPEGPYQYDKNNIQPRFGLAYQWNEKTVFAAARQGFPQPDDRLGEARLPVEELRTRLAGGGQTRSSTSLTRFRPDSSNADGNGVAVWKLSWGTGFNY